MCIFAYFCTKRKKNTEFNNHSEVNQHIQDIYSTSDLQRRYSRVLSFNSALKDQSSLIEKLDYQNDLPSYEDVVNKNLPWKNSFYMNV